MVEKSAFRINKDIGGFLTETPLSMDQTKQKIVALNMKFPLPWLRGAITGMVDSPFGEDYQEIDRAYLDENA